jgi:hypothetical protein
MIEVKLTIEEAENIVMMHEFCIRWYSHEYAVNAIKKIRTALKERPQRELEFVEIEAK